MTLLEHVGLLVGGLSAFAAWPNLRGNPPKATSDTVEGIPCNLTQRRASRGNKVSVTVALPCDERFQFTLRRARIMDRLATNLGLTREFKTQDRQFDEQVYIGADERCIDDWLAQDSEVRKRLLDLLELKPQEFARVTSITANRGRITLYAIVDPPMFERAPDDIARICATASISALKSCADHLQAFAARYPDSTAFRDPYAPAIRTLSGLALGLFVVPLGALYLAQLRTSQVELATNPLWDHYCSPPGIVLVVCSLMAVALPLLWGSTRLHVVLMPLVLSGAFAALLSVPTVVREVNIDWDRSGPMRYNTHVLRRYEMHSRGGIRYHVWVEDWRSRTQQRELLVDEATYDQMQLGAGVSVSERAGYLGRRWVSDISRDYDSDQ